MTTAYVLIITFRSLDSKKKQEHTPFTLSCDRRYAVLGYQRISFHQTIRLQVYPQLFSDENDFKEYQRVFSKYIPVYSISFSVDSLSDIYFDFYIKTKGLNTFSSMRVDWNISPPGLKTCTSVATLIDLILDIKGSKLGLYPFTITVQDFVFEFKKGELKIKEYLDTLLAYKAQVRSRIMCGISRIPNRRCRCTVSIQINLLYHFPAWQKRLLLMRHKSLNMSISFPQIKVTSDTRASRLPFGEVLVGSLLLNNNLEITPIAYPLFSITQLQLVLGKVSETTEFRYSVVGEDNNAHLIHKLATSAKLVGHTVKKSHNFVIKVMNNLFAWILGLFQY